MNWEFGIGRCKLLHLGWINNNHKTTRSYYISQRTIANLLDKSQWEITFKRIYMCITESLCYTADIGTTL